MYTDLSNASIQVDTSKDSIVINRCLDDLRGGRSLSVAAYAPEVIQAGHVIIKETATGDYKPMPVTGEPYAGGNAYAALPAGHTYEGILKASILKTRPMAGILTIGSVVEAAMPYPIASIKAAFKTAKPLIDVI